MMCLVAARRSFTTQNTFLGSINPDRNHNLRVMSTPEWPVPYYQRAFRHPASLEKREGNLNHFLVPVHDFHAILAKETLKSMKLGASSTSSTSATASRNESRSSPISNLVERRLLEYAHRSCIDY